MVTQQQYSLQKCRNSLHGHAEHWHRVLCRQVQKCLQVVATKKQAHQAVHPDHCRDKCRVVMNNGMAMTHSLMYYSARVQLTTGCHRAQTPGLLGCQNVSWCGGLFGCARCAVAHAHAASCPHFWSCGSVRPCQDPFRPFQDSHL